MRAVRWLLTCDECHKTTLVENGAAIPRGWVRGQIKLRHHSLEDSTNTEYMETNDSDFCSSTCLLTRLYSFLGMQSTPPTVKSLPGYGKKDTVKVEIDDDNHLVE